MNNQQKIDERRMEELNDRLEYGAIRRVDIVYLMGEVNGLRQKNQQQQAALVEMREALEQFVSWAQNDISIYGGGGQHVGTPMFTGRRVAAEVKSMCDYVLSSTAGEATAKRMAALERLYAACAGMGRHVPIEDQYNEIARTLAGLEALD